MANDYKVTAHGRKYLLDMYKDREGVYKAVMAAAISIFDRILPPKVVVAKSQRLKDFESFSQKANKLIDGELKYNKPFEQIDDLVGLRVVVIAKRHIEEVCNIIRKAFEVVSTEDKAADLLAKGQLGYESYHFVCKLGKNRSELDEYEGLCEQVFEIQVRTALQHAWAENEHRIQYKKTKDPELQKRFLRLAAAVSSADEEFDRIYEIDEKIRMNAVEAEKQNVVGGGDAQGFADDNDSILANISLQFGLRPSELLADGREAEAIQVYDRFIDAQPKQVTHYVGRAKARALSGDIEAGLSDLKVAKEISKNHAATKALERFFDRLLKDINEEK